MGIMESFPRIMEESRELLNNAEKSLWKVTETIGNDDCSSLNAMALGDNCNYIKHLLDDCDMEGKVKMVYIDPPFYSKSKYDAVIKLKSEKCGTIAPIKHLAYEDIWETGIEDYLKMMAVRLYLIKELLTEDGTIWIHLDWHIVHYVKILADEIFGVNNFINEIIWQYKSGGTSKKHFSRKHDTILVYSKGPKYYFEPQKEKSYNRGYKPYRFKGVKEYKDELGWYTMVNMKDVWQIDMVGRTSAERTGYATQKPEALLARIIESATEEGDICADFFCGSATLAAVANKLNRRWICCDNGRLAIVSGIKRLSSNNASFNVFELDDAKEDKTSSKIELKYSLEELDLMNKSVLKIELVKYRPSGYTKIIDDKSLASIKKIISKDSLQLIEYWSVDYSYDGKVHKPEQIFIKNKDAINITSEKLLGNIQNVNIEIVDVFGNRIYNLITRDELLNK